MDVDIEEEEKEPNHPNVVDFFSATRVKHSREMWRKEMQIMQLLQDKFLKPKKLLFEEDEDQNNIQFKFFENWKASKK